MGQPNILLRQVMFLAFEPLSSSRRGEMFIERATAKRFCSLRGAKRCSTGAVIAGNIALRWSAGCAVNSGAINIWLLWSQDLVAV